MVEPRDLAPNWVGALAVDAASAQRTATAAAGPQSRVAALLTLREFPGAVVGELAAILDLTHSATVRVLDGLVADGLAARARQGTDARRVATTLTAEGRRTADRLQHARLRALDRLLDPLTPGQRAQFADLLDAVLHGNKRDRATARRTCRFCAHRVCAGAACPIGRSVPSDDVHRRAQ